MRNEWRSNLWMGIELVIVGVVLWVIFGIFAGLTYLHKDPEGVDFNNLYIGRVDIIPEDATTRKQYPDTLHNVFTDIEMMLTKLRANPYVESLGVGGNAIPYNYNYSGNQICARIGDSIQIYAGNERHMTPELLRTLRVTGVNGETSEQLAAMLDEGKIIISKYDRSYTTNVPEKWVGHEAWYNGDSAKVMQVGALIPGYRRTDYEPIFGGIILKKLPADWIPWEVAFRVKPGTGEKFMQSLKADDLEFGNAFICDVQNIENRKAVAHHDVSVLYRNLTAGAAFLLVVVFLGFLGSFWYRTQQRIPELALRKVNGATNADLFRRFIAEGLILLAIATVPITVLVAVGMSQIDFMAAWIPLPTYLFWSMLPVTLAVLALMIIAGIWMPARKAMRINPAAALKDQ